MPRTFPGMDPYLEAEALWPWFRHQLVVTLAHTLSPNLTARYAVQPAQHGAQTITAEEDDDEGESSQRRGMNPTDTALRKPPL